MHTPGEEMRSLGSLPAPAWSSDLSQESVGQRLRARREQLGESMESVLRDTRLSRQAVEALEADDYESISSDFYVRGFLKIYARYLEFDPVVVLEAYDRQTSVSRLVTTGEPEEHDEVHTYFQVQAPKGRTLSPAQILLLFITATTLVVFMLSVNKGKKVRPEVARRPAVTAPGTPATATNGGRLPLVAPTRPNGTQR
ncbi:MAG: helix-turn-helix domain-containing protein [Myxococcales bacterium]|nr:helix-turn-helix domain-containing protein [Myxococcales bacterium]